MELSTSVGVGRRARWWCVRFSTPSRAQCGRCGSKDRCVRADSYLRAWGNPCCVVVLTLSWLEEQMRTDAGFQNVPCSARGQLALAGMDSCSLSVALAAVVVSRQAGRDQNQSTAR